MEEFSPGDRLGLWGGVDNVFTDGHGRIRAALLVGVGLSACVRVPVPRTALDERPPRVVSAFFGLDHALPAESRWLCATGPGADGMPVTFSRRVAGAVDPAAFTVTT